MPIYGRGCAGYTQLKARLRALFLTAGISYKLDLTTCSDLVLGRSGDYNGRAARLSVSAPPGLWAREQAHPTRHRRPDLQLTDRCAWLAGPFAALRRCCNGVAEQLQRQL